MEFDSENSAFHKLSAGQPRTPPGRRAPATDSRKLFSPTSSSTGPVYMIVVVCEICESEISRSGL